MANRHLSRSIILQTLFEWDAYNFERSNFKEMVQYTFESFLNIPLGKQIPEILETLENIAKKRVILDEIIEKAAPGWDIDKITAIDRNILRLGMYELIFGDRNRVPAKVAINEAIELAKRFGGPKSSRFVNGVIGAVYRELGEPGKDQNSSNTRNGVAYEDMPIDQKGAAVVYSIDTHGVIRIGMVHDVFGYWTLSKGGIEEGESVEEGTVREIKEETDWTVRIVQKLGNNEYIANHPQRGPVRKQVTYFLAKSKYTTPILEKDSGGLDDVRWFGLDELSDLNIYDDVSQMLIKTVEILTSQSSENNTKEKITFTQDELLAMSLSEIKAFAQAQGLNNYADSSKEEIVNLLMAHQK